MNEISSFNRFLKNPRHWVKRFFQKIVIDARKYSSKDEYTPRSEYESVGIDICRSSSKLDDSELLISPKSGKRFINNARLKLNVIIKDDSIDIIKNEYANNIPISPRAHEMILNIFDGHVEMRREKMESEIRSQITQSLDIIKKETKNLVNKIK